MKKTLIFRKKRKKISVFQVGNLKMIGFSPKMKKNTAPDFGKLINKTRNSN